MRIFIFFIFVAILACVPLWGQNYPDTPGPQEHHQAAKDSDHNFWDVKNSIGIAGMIGLRTADNIQSCYYMSHYQNFHEVMSPFHTCAGLTFYLSATNVTLFAGMQSLHDNGHHRVERWIPYISMGVNLAALIWNAKGSAHGIPCARQFGCGGN